MENGKDFKVTYCLNGWKWLWRQLMLSLSSLRRFIKERENIVVFYGPPHFQEHIDWLKPRCDLRLVDKVPLHDPKSMSERKLWPNKVYYSCMVFHTMPLDTPTLFWIDCDTIVHADLRDMLKRDFDVFIAHWNHSMGKNAMRELCKQAGLPHMEMMMNGFAVYKNYSYQKIGKYWLDYTNQFFRGELECPGPHRFMIYSYHLALIKFKMEGGNVVTMPENWHAYAGGKYVQHLARREIATWMEEKMFTPEMHKLAEVGAHNGKW